MRNIDSDTVDGFGDEWARFDQSAMSNAELKEMFDTYFGIFEFPSTSPEWTGFDLGCGSGRWASLVAPRVKCLNCIDPSAGALAVARRNLRNYANCVFYNESVDSLSLPDASQDFGYSLGVLHHVPYTEAAMAACTRKLKPGAPFLVYIYYAFDNRPAWFRLLWRISNFLRHGISRMPLPLRYIVSQVIALTVYWPLARLGLLAGRLGIDTTNWPLNYYSSRSLYVMRTDALDRFGTRLEHRFSRRQIQDMMERSGLEAIRFSDRAPFWCAVGYKRREA